MAIEIKPVHWHQLTHEEQAALLDFISVWKAILAEQAALRPEEAKELTLQHLVTALTQDARAEAGKGYNAFTDA